MFEREPSDEVNVASFVKDIAKIGYHPIFYTNIGKFFPFAPDGPLLIGSYDHPKLGRVEKITGANAGFLLGNVETPA